MTSDTTRSIVVGRIPTIESPREGCIVQIYGGEIGRRVPIVEEVSVGREEDNSVVLDMDTVSRRHTRFFPRGEQCIVMDLGSTNGTYVNDTEIHAETPLRNGDLVKIGGVIFKFISGGNIEGRYHEEIYRMTIIDGLTQIHNKRYFMDFLDREMARCARYRRPLSLALLDIDHFKSINDLYGHLAGDYVLRRIAERVAQQIRREELFARYGGEEFALVLPESTLEKAAVFAEKVRRLVEGVEFHFEGHEIGVTISAGVTTASGPMALLEFIKTADTCLYEAKRKGRNRVIARQGPAKK